MDRNFVKLVAGVFLILDLLCFSLHIALFDPFTPFRWCLVGVGLFLVCVIWRNREPLPEPHLQINLNHTNLTAGTTILSVSSTRNGYAHVALRGTVSGNYAFIPCGVFYVVAGKMDDFNLKFPPNSKGEIIVALFPKRTFDRESGELALFETQATLE
jgi:hypothetical protein